MLNLLGLKRLLTRLAITTSAMAILAGVAGAEVSEEAARRDCFSRELTVNSVSLSDDWATIQSRKGAPTTLDRGENLDLAGTRTFANWEDLTVGLGDQFSGRALPLSLRGSKLEFEDCQLLRGDPNEKVVDFFRSKLQVAPRILGDDSFMTYLVDIKGPSGAKAFTITAIVVDGKFEEAFLCWLPEDRVD
ncbi:MAG: hypothetical protein KIS61_34290 [Candidatus Eremiobacteraeota bacterium]|nr:hypothetical protein [Candidatus Eremiobacteraeota bacterium]